MCIFPVKCLPKVLLDIPGSLIAFSLLLLNLNKTIPSFVELANFPMSFTGVSMGFVPCYHCYLFLLRWNELRCSFVDLRFY